MLEIGEVRKGTDVGKKSRGKFIWFACRSCGRERWVIVAKGKPQSLICFNCCQRKKVKGRIGKQARNWKGGRNIQKRDGYVRVWINPDDFFYPMADKRGYVLEHRLVVAKALGRNLHSWELVHHKKGFAKDDNRYPETLQLVMEGQHQQITIMESRITHLEGKIEEQTKFIKLLQWQIKELQKISSFTYRE